MIRLFALAAGLLLASAAAAQAWPSRPVKLVVPFPAGSATDQIARVVGQQLQKALGQPFVVDNKAGASGSIAAAEVAKAAPDGYTLMVTTNTPQAANVSLFKKLNYDPVKDFAPVAHLSSFQVGLGVGSAVPGKTLADYVAWVKADPQKNGFYASAAPGSIPHFFGVMFAKSAGLTLTHVPYKGTAAAMTAIAGGEVSAISTVAADIRALVSGGKARLLAVAGEQRDASFPDVPTFRELGYDLVSKPWYGLFAPAGTPPAAVDRLAQAVQAALADPTLHKRLVEMGLEPTGYGPERLGAILKEDLERWGPPIRASGFKGD
jgi:tripartite-type tricarboxylate transporter receptor subunit TctC